MNRKSLAVGLALAMIFSPTSVNASILGFGKDAILTFSHSDVDIGNACSYYNIYNNRLLFDMPDDEIYSLKLSNVKGWIDGYDDRGIREKWGTVTEYGWEYKSSEEYDCSYIERETFESCYETLNGTIGCVDDFTETKVEKYCERDIWVSLDDAKTAKKIKIKPLNEAEVRFCGNAKPEETSIGWTISIDHIPELDGYAYEEYAWWDSNWANRVEIANQSDGKYTSRFTYFKMDLSSLRDAGKLQGDSGDFRLAYFNGTAIDFKILQPTTGENTTIWFNYTYDEGVIYAYYNNPAASDYTEYNISHWAVGHDFDTSATGAIPDNPMWTDTGWNAADVVSTTEAYSGTQDGNKSVFIGTALDTYPLENIGGNGATINKGKSYMALMSPNGVSDGYLTMTLSNYVSADGMTFAWGTTWCPADEWCHESSGGLENFGIYQRAGAWMWREIAWEGSVFNITLWNDTNSQTSTQKNMKAGTGVGHIRYTGGYSNQQFYMDNVIFIDIAGETVADPVFLIGVEESSPVVATPTNITIWFNGTEGNHTDFYGNSINITAVVNTTGVPVELWINGTLKGNGTTLIENITNSDWFTNATYNITANYNGNETYNSSILTYWLIINKQPSTIHIAINGTEADTTIFRPAASNATAWAINGTVSLLRNGTVQSNPDYSVLGIGAYNYTANISSENYTATTLANRILTVIGLDTYVTTNITSPVTYGDDYEIYSNFTIETSSPAMTTPIFYTLINGTQYFNSSGLVGYWKADNTTGNTSVQEHSGYGNTGTFTGGTYNAGTITGATWINGIHDGALEFDGNDKVTIPHNQKLNPLNNETTITAWIYPKDNAEAIVSKSYKNYEVLISAGKLKAYFGNVVGYNEYDSGYTPTKEVWTYIAVNVNGTHVNFFVNGNLETSLTQLKSLNTTDTTDLTIGSRGSAVYFNGTIDDVKIYNRSLTNTEVINEYGQNGSIVGDQVLWLPFDFGSGKTIFDANRRNQQGIYRSAFEFDGVNDYIDLGDTSALDILAAPFTFSYWINVKGGAGTHRTLFSRSTNGIEIEIGTANKLQINKQGVATMGVADTALSLDTWYHVALTYDGNDVRFYLDGETDGSSADVGRTFSNTAKAEIGRNTGASNYFNGTMDDIQIYNRTLTGTEARRLYELGATDFSVGAYNITTYTDGNSEWGESSSFETLVVNQASTTLHIALNGTEANRVYTWPDDSNATTWVDIGGSITFLRNGSAVANPNYDDLGVGVYNYTATIDMENYTATPIINRYLTMQQADMSCNLLLNGTDGDTLETYGINTNATATLNETQTYDIERNGSSVASGTGTLEDVELLSVGAYNYTLDYKGDVNHTNCSEMHNTVVQAANVDVDLFLNGSESNIVITYPSVPNITTTINTTLDYSILINGTAVDSGNAILEYIERLGAGDYNISADYNGTVNYTSNSVTYILTVQAANVDVNLFINGTEANDVITYPANSNITSTINTTLDYSILLNGTAINSGTATLEVLNGYAARAYNISADYNGTVNYTANSATYSLLVKKSIISLNISLNGTQSNTTIAYPTATNATSAINSTLTYTFYRNGSSLYSGTATHNEYDLYGYGVHNFTSYYLGDENNTAISTTWYLTVNQGYVGYILTSTEGWILQEGTETTINGTANISTTLTRNGITIVNPSTFMPDVGNYVFVVAAISTGNYTPSNLTRTLYVTSGGWGCTNNETFAFGKNITTNGYNYTYVDFTTLVGDSYVLDNLGDVRTNTTGATTYVNASLPNTLIVNATGLNNFTLRFGNYYRNVTHSTLSLELAKNATNDTLAVYSETGNYTILELMDEVSGGYLQPPHANNTLSLYCDGGTTSFNVYNDRLLVSPFMQLNWMRLQTRYSASDFYYRTLKSTSTHENKDFFTVDATEYQMAQVSFTLYDSTGDYAGSAIEIKRYLDDVLETITEMDFDAENKALTYLINGEFYKIYVDVDGVETLIGEYYTDTNDLDKNIIIGETTPINRSIANITYEENYNGTHANFTFNDYAAGTELIEYWVYNASNTSQIFCYNTSTADSAFFECKVPVVNASYVGSFRLKHEQFGNSTTYRAWNMVVIASILPPTTFPLFLLIGLLGGSAPLWVSILFIIPTGMIFHKNHTVIAGMLVIGMTFLFSIWFNYATSTAVLALAFIMIVIIEINKTRGKKGG